MAGSLLRNGLLEAQDKAGRSLAEVLSGHGFDPSAAAISAVALPRERILGCGSVSNPSARGLPSHRAYRAASLRASPAVPERLLTSSQAALDAQ